MAVCMHVCVCMCVCMYTNVMWHCGWQVAAHPSVLHKRYTDLMSVMEEGVGTLHGTYDCVCHNLYA